MSPCLLPADPAYRGSAYGWQEISGEYWPINRGVSDVIWETRVNNSQYFWWRNSKLTNEGWYFEEATVSKLIQIQIKRKNQET